MQKNHSDKSNPNTENKKERELADKVADGKKGQKKDKAEKNDGRNGATLGEINGQAGKDNE